MVNDTIDITSHSFDFHFESASESEKNQHLASKALLPRSCSGFDQIAAQQSTARSPNGPLSCSLHERLLPHSAENLSWSFFDRVSSLDNHLRAEHTIAISETNECHQLTASTVTSKDAHSMVIDAQLDLGQQQQPLTIINKPNGQPLVTTSKIAVDIVPQQTPDVILKQQRIQHKRSNSTILSPQTTLQLKQQQQQHHQHQFHQYNNNNQRGLQTKNHLEPPSPSQPLIIATQTDRSPAQSSQDYNERITAMFGGIERTTGSAAAATTNAAAATKTRTLPTIGRLTTTYANAKDVDLVAAPYEDTLQSQREQVAQALRKRRKMGAGSKSLGGGSFVEGIETHLGLVGWRKKCLYTLLALLMLLIIVNLVLTLWILKVMEFSADGMGQLKIIPGGIQLTGQAIIMDMLRASTIRSRHGQPISIESSRNFSINTRDTNGVLENHLFLGHDKLECLATGFYINDTNERNLFSVNRDEVTIGAHALRVEGEGGAIFRESVQTPHVRAPPGRELRLESPTRKLELTAAKDINLQSRAGGIEISALDDIKLSALDGSLLLESSTILMPNLRTAQPPLPGSAQSRDHQHRVFQLCACSNGKLFLAAPHSICAGDENTVCR